MKTIKLNAKDARDLILIVHHQLLENGKILKQAKEDQKAGKKVPLKTVDWVEYLHLLEYDKESSKKLLISLQRQTGIVEVPEAGIIKYL